MDSSIKPLIDSTTDDICWIKSNSSFNVYTFLKNDDYDLELNDNYAKNVVAGVFVTIESIGGTLLNLLVIIALLRNTQLRKEYLTPFIISNAMTDLIFSSISLPTMSIRCFLMKWPNIPCSWHLLLLAGTWTCSAWNLLGVALIRCYLIYRKKMNTSKYFRYSSIIIPLFAWIISFGIIAPTFFGVNGRFGLSCKLQVCILVNVDCSGNSLDYEPLVLLSGHTKLLDSFF